MLVEFRVKNFRSFQEEQVLSMVASADRSLSENTSSASALGKRKVLRSAVVYGANAAGKSNLLKAVRFARHFILTGTDKRPDAHIAVQPFRFDHNSREAESEFEFTFIHEGVRYQYGFTVARQRVHEEWLFAYPKKHPQKWFERSPAASGSEWYFGSQLKGEKMKLVPLTRDNVLFLSVAANFAHKQLSNVYNWFSQHLWVVDADDSSDFLVQLTAQQVMANELSYTSVKDFLKLADLGIIDFSLEERASESELARDFPEELRPLTRTNRQYDIHLHHRAKNAHSRGIPLALTDESHGTRRLFALGAPWLKALQAGITLLVDELDSSIHSILVRELISMFHDAELNPEGAQLIFNTQDVSLLDLSLFRRDQIWLVEKDQTGASVLYPLLDFSPRKDESLENGYLQGRYGAIPFIDDILKRNLCSHGKT
ncbi:MAG: AAA family ATPase [Ardenticatenaceae bacterium]